jgi:hypothetical protein
MPLNLYTSLIEDYEKKTSTDNFKANKRVAYFDKRSIGRRK